MLVDDDYLWNDVKAEVQDALLDEFSFEARSFGEPVTAAEVVREVHGVDGVVAVDLDELYLVDASGLRQGPPYSPILASRPAHYDTSSNEILAAELLLLHESGITLTRMSAT